MCRVTVKSFQKPSATDLRSSMSVVVSCGLAPVDLDLILASLAA